MPASTFSTFGFRHLIVSGALLLGLSQTLFAQTPADAKKGSVPAIQKIEYKLPDAIRETLQDRNYAAAIKALDAALAAPDARKDYLLYHRGRAAHLAKDYDDAVATFLRVEKDYSTSPWARRARLSRAVTLARKGDFQGAEELYKSEAKTLLSLERKQEIADIYLEFADAFFQPKDEIAHKPDYAKALDFYTQALAVGVKPDEAARIELRIARARQLLAKYDEAIAAYQAFLKKYPCGEKSTPAEIARDIEARYRLGETQMTAAKPLEARRTWQDLIAAHVDEKHELIAQATFELAATWNIPAPRNAEELSLGIAALEKFVKRYPDHKLAPQAALRIGRSYLHVGRADDAIRVLNTFTTDPRYVERDETADARQLLGRAYLSQKKFAEAIAAWRQYLVKHPAHAAWSEVQRGIIDAEYLRAEDARQNKDFEQARKLWGEFLAKYPLDARSARILYTFGQMLFDEKKWDAATDAWRKTAAKYPQTNEASLAQYMIGLIYEQKLDMLDKALEEFRKTTYGGSQNNAKQAIARLTSKQLRVATERVFRSGETPKIQLQTRNLDAVTVRCYRIDLETYFRKMHDVQGIEGLDIALIDPDKTFEYKIPEYADYRHSDNHVEVPLPPIMGREKIAPAVGAMAITVASKTLETTTLVLVSDLDMIVKSSRDETLVFAQNMKTGKPLAGAKLIFSDGKAVFAEGETGPDGVYKAVHKELREAPGLRVFARSDAGSASNMVDLSGIGISSGLQDLGLIYTDRPAYRAGQVVHIRGVIRHAVDDQFVLDKTRKYQLEVFDPRNRNVWNEKLTQTEFGGVRSLFTLPATSPSGTYRITVRDLEQTSGGFNGSFLVQDYSLEPIRLSIDATRRIVYRGEELTGKIVAKYYYGAPLVGKEIRYQLGDGAVQIGRTDAKGEIAYKFPTRELRESQIAPLVVTLTDRNLTIRENFVVASQGFTLTVATPRSIYISGESWESTVTAKDAEGKPLKQKLTLTLLKQNIVAGRIGEVEIAKHDVVTDEKTGIAKKTFQLDKGGNYILRAEGIDRFENAVAGQAQVGISGEEDRVRLRILADKLTWEVGQTATARIHWRERPALALATFQGARILDYKLIELKTGENEFAISLTAKLAPNFDLSLAVMQDAETVAVPDKAPDAPGKTKNPATDAGDADAARAAPTVRFHEAVAAYIVERKLNVELETKRKDPQAPLRPGEEVELTIRTSDAVGKPQSAELSVALVEESLLRQFGSNVSTFNGAFMGNWRASAMRSGSSIAFAYRPQTHAIDKQLLAELERREIESDEETRRAAGIPFGIVTEMEGDSDNAIVMNGVGTFPSNGGVLASSANGQGLNFGNHDEFGTNDLGLLFTQQQAVHDRRGYGVNVNAPQSGEQNGLNFTFTGSNSSGSAASSNPGFLNQNESQQGGLYFNSMNPNVDVQALNGGITNISHNSFFCESNGGNLLTLNNSGQRDVVMVNPSNGEQWNFNYRNTFGQKFDVALADQVGKKLAAGGNLVLAQVGPQETGYWNPQIVTDESGVAKLTITMPEQSTAWKLSARGVTHDTLSGEAEESFVVKQDLFGELKLPAAFTDGDEVEVQALIHNDLLDKGTIEVVFRTIISGKLIEEKKTLEVAGKGIQELSFRTTIKRQSDEDLKEIKDQKIDPSANLPAMFELSVKSGAAEDLLRRAVPIVPYGVPVYAVQGGTATGDTTIWIEPPTGIELKRPRLQIVLGSSVDRGLLDILLGPALTSGIDATRTSSGLDSATSDLMAAIALQKLFDKTRDAGTAQAQAIDTRIRSAIGQLVAAQRDDGAWSWSGYGKEGHRFTTARVYWALTLANKAGYKISDEATGKARAYLQSQLAGIDETDFETKAVLLHALSVSGHGDFAQANRLHRNKSSLSPTTLIYTALAFLEMDRKPVANELLTALPNEAALVDLPTRRGSPRGILPWSASGVELKALQALALSKIAPEDAKLKKLIDDLMAARRGHRWTPEKATGPAALAVCDWFARARFETEAYALKIFVNDKQVEELQIEKDAETQTVDVPDRFLKAGKNRINLQLTGRGRYTFQAILGGFVPAENLINTTKEWVVERRYEPSPRELDGFEIPRGFDVVAGGYQSFRNPLTQLPVGKRGQLTLEVTRHNVAQNAPEEQLDYLVVTESLPSGASVVEQSIRGDFERYELGPGTITFYVGSQRYVKTITFDIHGYLPGAYRVSPTIVRNAYRLDDIAVSKPLLLTVLTSDKTSADQYKETPLELFEYGKRYFEKHDKKSALPYLTRLFKDWPLNVDTYRKTVEMLFEIHLAEGPAGDTVRYFEIIKERYPEQEISFEKIMKVAAAYETLGEYERSYMVYRAILENSFIRENGVAGYLEQQGEFLRSVEVMQRLLAEYPPEPYAATTLYSLAQRVYEYAPQAATDAKLREKKINKVALVQQALGMLDNFLTLYPDDPAADQAAFSLSNALLELKAYKELIARATKYAQRYSESDYLDSYWYLVAYGHFALQEHEEALKMAAKVATSKRIDKATGREVESPNKWQAVYILGQVYHSLGRAAEAVREYTRVEDRFADAKEAIAYFLRKEIQLPEVVTLKPNEPVVAELTFRNIPSVDLKVYRIDLMKFSLLKRNLSGISQINLSGIRPTHEATIELGDGKDYRDRTKNIELPFKDEGAYLVVCRGESLHASGLILISPLVVDVQEEAGEGRVRVTVKDVTTDKYLARVQAKVIGSRNGEFISGNSDLRGVFIADGVKGTSTVIAQADDGRYAFFRGTRELGPSPAPNAQPAQAASPQGKDGPQQDKEGELLQELKRGNKMLQERQRGILDNNYKMNNDGVKAKSAF